MSASAEAAGQSALQLKVFTSPTRPINGMGDQTFAPTTSTLVFGDTDAVLVDAQFLKEDVQALGDMIEAARRRLTTIFITHGHGDHYFGIEYLAGRFPGVRMVATPGVSSYIETHHDEGLKTWHAMFGNQTELPTALPSGLDGDVIGLEGRELKVIEVGQGDIAPSAVLHVPSLDAVIAGDVAYNRIHQMLAFSGPAEWEKWIESVETIRSLTPRIVVAGHKKPDAADDQAEGILSGTQAYIRDFAEASNSAGSVEALVSAMRVKYPGHGNLTTLLHSADAAMKARSH